MLELLLEMPHSSKKIVTISKCFGIYVFVDFILAQRAEKESNLTKILTELTIQTGQISLEMVHFK